MPKRLAQTLAAVIVAAGLGGCSATAPPPASEPPPVSSAGIHVTRSGETLCAIGGRYGVSAHSLAETNRRPEGPDAILPSGVELATSGIAPASYRVREGDTLSRIASWSGVDVSTLAAANQLADPNRVRTGATLRIPPGARTSCPPPIRIARARPSQPQPEPEPQPESVPVLRSAPSAPLAPVAEPAHATPPPDLVQAAAELSGAEERYADADYDGAAREAAGVREQLGSVEDGDARQLAARAAALEALCHVGRQRRTEAVASFRTAFELDPAFELDRAYASPAVMPLVDQARAKSEP